MKFLFPVVTIIALASSGAALADDDCRRPMAEWQSRDAVAAHVAKLGVTAERLRIDDGCYEIRGQDGAGNRIELKLDPATLEPLALEVRFRPGADVSRYLSSVNGQTAPSTIPPAAKALNAPSSAAPADPE